MCIRDRLFSISFLINPFDFFLLCVILPGHAPSSMSDVLSARWIRFRSQTGVKVAVPLSRCDTGAEIRGRGKQDANRGGFGRKRSPQCVQSGWYVHVVETFRNQEGKTIEYSESVETLGGSRTNSLDSTNMLWAQRWSSDKDH